MSDITIQLHVGPSSQHDLLAPIELPLSDLITHWKKVYRLAEQDRHNEMIRYALYHDVSQGQAPKREPIDPALSLRTLRAQNFKVLYLADERCPWWQSGAPGASIGTAKLKDAHVRDARGVRPLPPPLLPPIFIPCSIELAPGCVRQVGEAGLLINREYLLLELPPSVKTRERALVLMGLESRLSAVSRGDQGHCSIVWKQSWYLIARSPIYIGSAKYSHNEAIQIEQTMTVLLGREGWPITIRLLSTSISR